MTAMTYDEILTIICDAYDSYISPKTIKRTKTNFIYLIFKATAKGFEIINNICVSLSNKFDPENCSDDDLTSTALIAGTKFLSGKGSSLAIKVYNGDTSSSVLPAGTYTYAYDADTLFTFTTTAATTIAAASYVSKIAVSTTVGSFPVTAQSSIAVTGVDSSSAAISIPDVLVFSCLDNSDKLGYAAETAAEFRERILSDPDRDSVIVELETALKNLPRIYDAAVYFNQTITAVTVGGITVPPFYMLITLLGDITDEVAQLVASYGVYPTVTGDGVVYYATDCFSGGQYAVNYFNFVTLGYTVKLDYQYSQTYYSDTEIQAAITTALASYFSPVKRKKYVTEDLFYTAVNALNLTSLVLCNVTLYNASGTEVSYLEADKVHMPTLTSVTFSGTAI